MCLIFFLGQDRSFAAKGARHLEQVVSAEVRHPGDQVPGPAD